MNKVAFLIGSESDKKIANCSLEYFEYFDINAEINDESCLYENECGDINVDNSIDIFDIVIMIDMILSNDFNYISDLNLDNNIDIIDIIDLLNIIL